MTQYEIDILMKIVSLADDEMNKMDEKSKHGHNRDFTDLYDIRGHVDFVIKYDGIDAHQEGVAGALKNIAKVVRRWGWPV